MWPFIRPAPAPAPAPAPPAPSPDVTLQIRAAPLIVGEPADPVGVANARIGHIRRHLAQHGASPVKMSEFRTEMFSLIHTLQTHGAISPEDERAALNMVGIV